MKIVSRGGTISTETYLARKRQARRRRLLIIFCILILITAGLIVFSRVQKFRINDISVNGASVIGADTVKNFSQSILNGYYLWVIPRNNVLLYPHAEIKRLLLENFPRFSSAEVSLANPNTLNISVVEREPFALYCGDSTVADGSTCYFLDNTGFIFDQAPSFSNGVYFVYASGEPITNPKGRQYLTPEKFVALRDFVKNLPSLHLIPESIKVNGTVFVVTLTHNAHITGKTDSVTGEYSNLESFMASAEIRNQKDFISNIAELDLRTSNKVFYKFK